MTLVPQLQFQDNQEQMESWLLQNQYKAGIE